MPDYEYENFINLQNIERIRNLNSFQVEQNNDKKNDDKDKPVEIFAMLSHKQYKDLQDGNAELEIPHGVKMTNKLGKRRLFFYCENREAADHLQEGLGNSGICWSEF